MAYITLCGSTRFHKEFTEYNIKLTMRGHVVYSIAMAGREAFDIGKSLDQPLVTPEEKVLLDLVHLAKIDNSDEIFVLDVNGYIGDSTKREIAWARMKGKTVRYLSEGFPF